MNEIILGITGSIAAYKGAEIISALKKQNVCVHVIMTQAGMKFITPLTFQTLTANKVHTDMFDASYTPDVQHISLAQRASCLCIAPATANIIGKMAMGIADDMLSTVAMAFKKPIIVAPAMNTAMFESAAVQENIRILTQRGVCFVEPKTSMLACGDFGRGALADVDKIVAEIIRLC